MKCMRLWGINLEEVLKNKIFLNNMPTTRKKQKYNKKKSKKGIGGKFNNRYFERLSEKSMVVKNMINNLNDTEDFMGFFLDLTAKYFNDLSMKKKKEAFEILI